MDLPSRRDRKHSRPKWSLLAILSKVVVVCVVGALTFVAWQTTNFTGLAATAVMLFFLALSINLGGIRQMLPGLNATHYAVKLAAVFCYAFLGIATITLAGKTPDFGKDFFHNQRNESYLTHNDKQEPEAALQPVLPAPVQDIQKPEVPDVTQNPAAQATVKPSVSPEQKPDNARVVPAAEAKKPGSIVTQVLNVHTLEVNDQQYIRLIGVVVPDELQTAAYSYLQEKVLNQEVTITPCPDRPMDDQGRTRAVVQIKGENLNQKLIEQGFSPLVKTVPCSLDLESWQAAEESAKENKRGIWEKHPE